MRYIAIKSSQKINPDNVIDSIEITKCINCKHFIPDNDLDHNIYPNEIEADGLCDNWRKYTDNDGFCNCGEQR